jgi:hypothetical protein
MSSAINPSSTEGTASREGLVDIGRPPYHHRSDGTVRRQKVQDTTSASVSVSLPLTNELIVWEMHMTIPSGEAG